MRVLAPETLRFDERDSEVSGEAAGPWGRLTGQKVGDDWRDVVDPFHLRRVEELWSTAIRDRAVYEAQFPITTVDGDRKVVYLRGVPTGDHEWTVVYLDVTPHAHAGCKSRATGADAAYAATFQLLLEVVPAKYHALLFDLDETVGARMAQHSDEAALATTATLDLVANETVLLATELSEALAI